MSYSSDMANLLTDQLSRFVTLNRHQLSGHVANLEFWLAEVRHALGLLDGYGRRFEQMRDAQDQYVADHGTTEFVLGADYPTEKKASSPRRIPDHEIRKARRPLTEAATRFLERCYREGLILESQWSDALKSLGIEQASATRMIGNRARGLSRGTRLRSR
jgi:hypothetical protein